MKFKAKIHGTVITTEGDQPPTDPVITFNGYRIKLRDDQIQRLWLSPILVNPIADNEDYTFDKLLNKDDKRLFSIILTNRVKPIDKAIYHLEISWWNKIKANIIHHRYWLYREREWFTKTLIAALIGFLFGLIGAKLGYRQGYENGLKAGKDQNQVTTPKK